MNSLTDLPKKGKRFQRWKEDFVCEYCHYPVQGDGFTNHCPKCLWSKHVDIFPGDRAAHCSGLMAPVGVEQKKSEWKILHRCTVCGLEKRNKKEANDSLDEILVLMKRGAE